MWGGHSSPTTASSAEFLVLLVGLVDMGERNEQFYFLDVLRGLAAWLVVWDHLFAVWPEQNGFTLPFVRLVREYINQPMGIVQDFGWLGVAVFFLISGFVITHVSLRETPDEFIIRRIFRIFPMLAVSVALSLLLNESFRSQLTLPHLITNIFLVNYWIHPQIIFVGVAWTLAIEIVFYALILLGMPLRAQPLLKVSFSLLAVGLTTYFARSLGANFFLFAATTAYVPFLPVGQIFYFMLYNRSISVIGSLLLLLVAYSELLFGIRSIHTEFLPIDNSYLVSFLVAIAIFLTAYGINSRLTPNRFIKLLSDTSYSLYLFHGLVGFFVLDQLTPRIGFPLALLLAVALVSAFVLVVNRTIEKPILEFGRRLSVRGRVRPV